MVIIAAATTERSRTSGFTIPLPIVVATAVPVMRTPNILRLTTIITALTGDRTCVETTVAIALGLSVQPLTNSAASTNSKTTISAGVRLSMLEGYPFQHVGHILTPVSSALHMFVNLPPLDNLCDVRSIGK